MFRMKYCGCCMFKSEKLKAEILCPACDEEMVRCVYVGERRIAKDIGSPYYAPLFVDDEFGEDGEPNYVELVSGSSGGCGVG